MKKSFSILLYEDEVENIIEALSERIDNALGLAGCSDIEELSIEHKEMADDCSIDMELINDLKMVLKGIL